MSTLSEFNLCCFRRLAPVLGVILLAAASPPLPAAEPTRPKPITLPATTDLSLRNEVQHAIDRGLASLQANQNPAGYWSTVDHPAITALALTAFQGEPTSRFKQPTKPELKRAYAFLLAAARPDGGIYQKELANYNTAVSMMTLLVANQSEYDPILRKARAFLDLAIERLRANPALN